MKTRMILNLVAVWVVLYGAIVWGYREGDSNNFFGTGAGSNITTGLTDTFVGGDAGHANTTGHDNTFLGYHAGHSNKDGYANTYRI